MKRAADTFEKILFFLMAVGCLFFGGSCGIEEVIVVAEPTVTYNNPLYSDSDSSYFYCDFRTNDSGNSDLGDSFLGTEVYYKIYNNSSTLVSERSSILAVNTTSSSTSAASKMIDTYTYQPLGTSPQNSDSIFVPPSDNRRVYFRPVDVPDSVGDDLKAAIIIYNSNDRDSSAISDTKKGCIPYRYSNDKSFDFFDNDDSDDSDKVDVEPVEGDLDYKHSPSSTADDRYFVQFFAVGVAIDTSSLSRSYSLVLDLGSMPIIKQ